MRFSDRIKMSRIEGGIALLDMKLQKPFLFLEKDRYFKLCNNMFNYYSSNIEDSLLEKLIKNGWVLTEEWPKSTYGYAGKIYHIIIEPTLHCNLNCSHCLRSAGSNEDEFMSFENYHGKVIPLINSLKPITVGFMGGEPTTNPDITKIIDGTLKNTESKIVLYTNGISVDSDLVEILTENAHRTMIQVSVDGCTAETHDSIRSAGSFKKTMRFLDKLRSKNYRKVLLKMTVIPDNVNEYDKLNEFVKENGWRLGISVYCRVGRGSTTEVTYEQMNDVLLGIMTDILKADSEFSVDAHMDSSFFFNRFPCGLGKKGSFTVDPYMNVIDCMNVRRNVGSLNTDDIDEIMHNYYRLYFPVVEDIPSCSECEFKYICKGGCRNVVYKHTGSVVGEQSYCKLFRSVHKKYFSEFIK